MRKSVRYHIATNLALSALILSVGVVCLFPQTKPVLGDGKAEIYRNADESSNAVSLMFNVYWGTEDVFEILEILKEHDAKATFFIGGCWADDNSECLKKIASYGHELGNHGYFHKDHKKLSREENEKEISTCNRFITLTTGITPTLFAPPSGSYGDNMLEACETLQMKTVLWSKDTIDWRDKDEKLVYKRATEKVCGGDFVLMHPMPHTVAALNDILTYYETNGLRAVTVSENLQRKG